MGDAGDLAGDGEDAGPDGAGDGSPDGSATCRGDAACPDEEDSGPPSPDAGEPAAKGPDFLREEGESYIVLAHHLRYQQQSAPDGEWLWTDHDQFLFWLDLAAPVRDNIFVSEVWRPSDPAQVKAVVMMLAGQQGMRQLPGSPANIVTGQDDGWRPPHAGSRVRSCELALRKQSVAGRLIRDGHEQAGARYGFRPDDTLLLLVFDTGFNYLLGQDAKEAAVAGYLAWVRDRLGGPGSGLAPSRYVFGGSSRGACLAVRLAKSLAEDPINAEARIRLGLLDPVANADQGEVGVTRRDPIPNPLNPEYEAWHTDLAAFFPAAAHERLAVLEIVGGGPVIDLGVVSAVHAFVDERVAAQPEPVLPFPYALRWVDRAHTDIGRPWHDDTAGALLDWLAELHGSPAAP